MSGAILPASFRTGTTIETAGRSPACEGSLMCGPVPENSPPAAEGWVLLGRDLPRNPDQPPPRRSRQGHHFAVAPDRKPERARRKPVAHQERADNASNCPGDHVAWMMRQDDDPARRDGECIDEHHTARSRPDEPDSDDRREHIGGMARWQARIFGRPGERPIEKRVDMAADERPRPSDQPLED